MHIPKTAGVTVMTIIQKHYQKEESYSTSMSHYYPDGSLDGFNALPSEHKNRLKLLYGHMGFGLHKQFPQPATYFTILRDPVERVISSYYYESRETRSPLYPELNSGEIDLATYVNRYTSWEMDNLQTRMISGNWHKRGFGPCTGEMLETAKKNLREHFAVVGITNRFDESYLLFKRAFGWPHVYYTKRNVTENRPKQTEIPHETLTLIRKHNQFDIQLYEYAQILLNAQIKEHGLSYLVELRVFQLAKAINQLYQNLRQKITWLYWEIRKYSIRIFIRNQWQRIKKTR